MNKEKVQICFFVTEEEKEHIKRIADFLSYSQTTVIRLAIDYYYYNIFHKSNI